MLALLNFKNYQLDYAIEYPDAIKRCEMTATTRLNKDFEGWFFHSDFQSIYIILSKVFNALYDISLSIEMTFNPNSYITDVEIDEDVNMILSEGFNSLKSNYNDKDNTLLEDEISESLNFLRRVMNELSPIVSFLQSRDTKTALILLRALFSLDLRFYFSINQNNKKPKFSELIDIHSSKECYLSELYDMLLEKNTYEHIFQAKNFKFEVIDYKASDNSEKKKIEFDFRPNPEYQSEVIRSKEKVAGFGSLIYELMCMYHHNAFPPQLIPGMRMHGNTDFSVLNSILSVVSLELLFMSAEKIEKSFHIEKTESGVPLSKILTQIMQEGSDLSQRKFPEHSFHQNIMILRYNLWNFFIFRDKIKHHYESIINQFILHLKEKGGYDSALHLIYF